MDAVAEAFAAVPREGFLPARVRHLASYDGPLEIGHGQTNSQPRTVADMLRLLDVRPGQRILDVGAGSGWTTALLAHLVGRTGRVFGVELEEDLARTAAANVEASGRAWATVTRAERGVLGLPEEAPFARILVSAEAATVPESLLEQLAEGGVMVIPVRGTMLRVRRHGEDLETSRHGTYRFVPLR